MRINRNYQSAHFFISALLRGGIRHFVISPGSRNTPLTLAADGNRKARCYSAIDERGAAFFATGIARAEGAPVALICTSGTAAAEYYPAVIEAFHQRIPLIVCTADRPAFLHGTGANQTIDQQNLYGSHTRFFCDTGLPGITKGYFAGLSANIARALAVLRHNPGPVHFNLPFEKPFEPGTATNTVEKVYHPEMFAGFTERNTETLPVGKLKSVFNRILKSRSPLILAGPQSGGEDMQKIISRIASRYNIPVFADIASNLRTAANPSGLIFYNYDTILKTAKELWQYHSDCIIVLGRTMTSAAVDRYLSENNGQRIIVNPYGDRFDAPGRHEHTIVKSDPGLFLRMLDEYLGQKKYTGPAAQQSVILKCETAVQELKNTCLQPARHLHEPALVNAILAMIPAESNLFLPNSLLYRDFDNFANPMPDGMTVFQNRGASGIEGNIASAAGIAAVRSKPTYLVIGDVAFYYDVNSLWLLKKHNIPLKIILVNNFGGRIFDHLPVRKYKKAQQEYFVTETGVDFKRAVSAFGGGYSLTNNKTTLRSAIGRLNRAKGFYIVEARIDPEYSLEVRKEFRQTAAKILREIL